MSAALKPEPMARVLDCTLDAYYRDPCVVPSLSQSIAKVLITKSPLHAWTAHPRMGAVSQESTKAKDEGTLIHKLLLGKGATLSVLEVDDYKTKAARELRDDALANGRLPVKVADYIAAQAAAETLNVRLLDAGVDLSGGVAEMPVEWHEEGYDGYVLCRGALDYFKRDALQIIDVKKIASADYESCMRYAYEYGLDIQDAAYRSAISKLVPDSAGRIDFVFAFVELEAPYGVNPVRLTGQFRDMGRARWDRAVRLWERCTREDHWPGYTESITTLEPPGWAIAKEEMINGSI